MLRRDYLLRMIQQAAEALARIDRLKRDRRWENAGEAVDAELEQLVGVDARTVSQLSQTELLARVIRGESTLAVKEKTLFVSALLKQAGDVAVEQDKVEEGRACYIKGLQLLLDALSEPDVREFPEFTPRVELFTIALSEAPLPMQTAGSLMQHYERTGQFAKAEDALFSMIELHPDNPELLDFGVAFCKRLLTKPDDALVVGNLPRDEVECSLNELSEKRKSIG
jgi:hypothetical protein